MKILIAEDDAVASRLLRMALEKLGHEVVSASDGLEAWERFDASPVRIVVSDWMMPGLDGLDLCRRIRGRKNTEYTWFILLTMRSHKDEYRQAMDAGIDDFLSKPLDGDELMRRLRVAERVIRDATQIRRLKQLLPICLYCKKIRDDRDYWNQIDAYIHEQTGTDFSHGICPECYETRVKPMLAEHRRKVLKEDEGKPSAEP